MSCMDYTTIDVSRHRTCFELDRYTTRRHMYLSNRLSCLAVCRRAGACAATSASLVDTKEDLQAHLDQLKLLPGLTFAIGYRNIR